MTSPLFTEIKVGDHTFKNRIVLAPMTRSRAGKERMPNTLMAEYYSQRAGAGLLITEATVISEQGFGWNESPGIYSDAQAEAWKQIVEAAHSKGSKIFLQLWHCGRASHSDFHSGELPVSASAIKLNGDHIHTPLGKKEYETPRALTTEEVKQTVQDYKKAAQRAKSAGFDGVEIHGANGYLIDQFLESKTNHRTDEYGGSLENRFRFLKEIYEAIATIYTPGSIGVRISPNGAFNDMGSPDYRETFLYVATELAKYKIAYLHVMDGLGFGFHELGEPMTLDEFKAVFPGVVIGNVGYTKESAEAAIESGSADMIAIGRPYISNPDLVERFKNNWPLNPDAAMEDWYTPKGASGYTDFPVYHS